MHGIPQTGQIFRRVRAIAFTYIYNTLAFIEGFHVALGRKIAEIVMTFKSQVVLILFPVFFSESILKPFYSFQVLLGKISRYDQKNHFFLA